jgi:hypothetical protein
VSREDGIRYACNIDMTKGTWEIISFQPEEPIGGTQFGVCFEEKDAARRALDYIQLHETNLNAISMEIERKYW